MSRPSTVPFLFDRDFRGGRKVVAPEDEAVPAEKHRAELGDAEQRGFAQGQAEGRREALDSEARRLADSVERLVVTMAAEAARTEERAKAHEAAAIELALAFAQKLAGTLIDADPLAAIEQAARQCFSEARQAPHVVVRVNDALVESVKERLKPVVTEKGFAGKLVILGEPGLAPGDSRLEWADGGIARDTAAMTAALMAAIDGHLAARDGRKGAAQ